MYPIVATLARALPQAVALLDALRRVYEIYSTSPTPKEAFYELAQEGYSAQEIQQLMELYADASVRRGAGTGVIVMDQIRSSIASTGRRFDSARISAFASSLASFIPSIVKTLSAPLQTQYSALTSAGKSKLTADVAAVLDAAFPSLPSGVQIKMLSTFAPSLASSAKPVATSGTANTIPSVFNSAGSIFSTAGGLLGQASVSNIGNILSGIGTVGAALSPALTTAASVSNTSTSGGLKTLSPNTSVAATPLSGATSFTVPGVAQQPTIADLLSLFKAPAAPAVAASPAAKVNAATGAASNTSAASQAQQAAQAKAAAEAQAAAQKSGSSGGGSSGGGGGGGSSSGSKQESSSSDFEKASAAYNQSETDAWEALVEGTPEEKAGAAYVDSELEAFEALAEGTDDEKAAAAYVASENEAYEGLIEQTETKEQLGGWFDEESGTMIGGYEATDVITAPSETWSFDEEGAFVLQPTSDPDVTNVGFDEEEGFIVETGDSVIQADQIDIDISEFTDPEMVVEQVSEWDDPGSQPDIFGPDFIPEQEGGDPDPFFSEDETDKYAEVEVGDPWSDYSWDSEGDWEG